MSTAASHRCAERATAPLAIICGGGSLPFAVAERRAARPPGGPVRAARLGRSGAGRAYPHHWSALGQFGRFCRLAREEGCRDVVFIGTVMRPATLAAAARLGTSGCCRASSRMFRGGDDHLLSGVAQHLRGARIPAARRARGGARKSWCRKARSAAAAERSGSRRHRARPCLARAIGPFDVGQAVVVADNHVLAVEAAEGTDTCSRASRKCAARPRPLARRGVLVKAPKPGQDRRFDLPSIGPQTIEGAARRGPCRHRGRGRQRDRGRAGAHRDAGGPRRLFVVGVRDEASGR